MEFDFLQRERFLSSPKRPERLWSLCKFLFSGHWEAYTCIVLQKAVLYCDLKKCVSHVSSSKQ
jgi:hypothetical protein